MGIDQRAQSDEGRRRKRSISQRACVYNIELRGMEAEYSERVDINFVNVLVSG
jgi:hypothetical protein